MIENRHVLSATIYDPGQDAKIPLLRVPDGHVFTIEKVYLAADRTTAAHGTNYFAINLLNGGTPGTAATSIGGTPGGVGGWVANTAKELTITSGLGDLTAGQWLVANYAENGTVAPGVITAVIEYVDGIGSKA